MAKQRPVTAATSIMWDSETGADRRGGSAIGAGTRAPKGVKWSPP